MASKIWQLEKRSNLSYNVKKIKGNDIVISTNEIDDIFSGTDKDHTDKLPNKINIEIGPIQRTIIFGNDPSMWI